MSDRADLELGAAQALFAARLLELAVHHEGPWTFKWGEIEIPAIKTLTDDGVSFVGHFPEVCYLRRPEGSLELRCEGMVLGMRAPEEFEHPGDTGFMVAWDVLSMTRQVAES